MAFTYTDTLLTDIDKVRFWIQDTIESKGPLPDNRNFSDAEVNGLLSIESSWQQAVAAGFETLSAAWAKETSFTVYNGAFSRSEAVKAYRDLAKTWRERYGDADTATDEVGSKSIDFSGNTVTPLFQREAFGYKVKDWDPA